MIAKLMCYFGWHKWKLTTYTNDHMYAVGDRCIKCGRWHDSAVRALKEGATEEIDYE